MQVNDHRCVRLRFTSCDVTNYMSSAFHFDSKKNRFIHIKADMTFLWARFRFDKPKNRGSEKMLILKHDQQRKARHTVGSIGRPGIDQNGEETLAWTEAGRRGSISASDNGCHQSDWNSTKISIRQQFYRRGKDITHD